MLVCFDLARLYPATKKKRLRLDFVRIATWAKTLGPNCELVALVRQPPKSPGFTAFLATLEHAGYTVFAHPCGPNDRFTADLAAIAGLTTHTDITLVTDDIAILRIAQLLGQRGKNAQVAFFSEMLAGRWIPHLVKQNIGFVDLSDEDVLAQIVTEQQRT